MRCLKCHGLMAPNCPSSTTTSAAAFMMAGLSAARIASSAGVAVAPGIASGQREGAWLPSAPKKVQWWFSQTQERQGNPPLQMNWILWWGEEGRKGVQSVSPSR